MGRSNILLRGALALALVSAAACGSASRSGRLRSFLDERLDYPERELRLRLIEYFRYFSGKVAHSSYAIQYATDDPEQRARAISWRIAAVATCHASALRTDALTSLIDTWTLVYQMEKYHAGGAGLDGFDEEFRAGISETIGELVAEIETFERFLPESGKGVARIRPWVEEHPMLDGYLARPSPVAEIARVIGDPDLDAFEAVRGLEYRVRDLTDRLTVSLEVIPHQLRWQGELALELAMARDDVDASQRDLSTIAVSLQRLSTLEADLRGIIAEERENVVARIRPEVDRVAVEVDRQRVDTLDRLEKERQVLLDSIEGMRGETLSTITAEREEVSDTLRVEVDRLLAAARQEREAVLTDLERQRQAIFDGTAELSAKLLDESGRSGVEIIDHLAWRIAQVGGGLLLLLLAGGLLVLRLGRGGGGGFGGGSGGSGSGGGGGGGAR